MISAKSTRCCEIPSDGNAAGMQGALIPPQRLVITRNAFYLVITRVTVLRIAIVKMQLNPFVPEFILWRKASQNAVQRRNLFSFTFSPSPFFCSLLAYYISCFAVRINVFVADNALQRIAMGI